MNEQAKNILNAVKTALENVSVKGSENWNTMLLCVNALEKLQTETDEETQEVKADGAGQNQDEQGQ